MSAFVKTIEDIKLGVKVENDTYFEAVEPYLVSAENEYLKPYLGDALFAAIQESNYDAAKKEKIINSIKIAVSCFAFYHIIQEGTLRLNEHGAFQATGAHQTSPSKWRDDNAKSELIKRGDRALDQLLDILMENIDDYQEWKDSKWYAIRTSLIISNAKDFDEYVPISRSTRVFLRLLPDIKKAMRLMPSLICDAMTKRITDHLKEREGTPEALDSLLPYLQAVVAYEAIVRAIPRFNFFMTPDGILFYSISDGTFQKMAASHSEKKDMLHRYKENLAEAKSELLAFLRNNLEDYPEFGNSPCSGQKMTTNPYYAYSNSKTNKHFAP